jgi:hypothetical protein
MVDHPKPINYLAAITGGAPNCHVKFNALRDKYFPMRRMEALTRNPMDLMLTGRRRDFRVFC